ncbi:MAG: hypothetical protein QG653_280 [Patescibacteria group bacterium]|nr:hypothetical protein [Patescibacteria group bacterium]
MCSKAEFSGFLKTLAVSCVTSRWVESPSSTSKEVTFRFQNGDKYKIVVSSKKKEDLVVSGMFSELKGELSFSEVKDGPLTTIAFTSEDGSKVSISSRKHISIAYVCAPDPKGVKPQPDKLEWKGPVRSTAREYPRRSSPSKAKGNGIKKVVRRPESQPKKDSLYLVKS